MNPLQLARQSWNQHWLKLKQEQWLRTGCVLQDEGDGQAPRPLNWKDLEIYLSDDSTTSSIIPDLQSLLPPVHEPTVSEVLWSEHRRLSDRQDELRQARIGFQGSSIVVNFQEGAFRGYDRQTEADQAALESLRQDIQRDLAQIDLEIDRQTEVNDRATKVTDCDFSEEAMESGLTAAQIMAERGRRWSEAFETARRCAPYFIGSLPSPFPFLNQPTILFDLRGRIYAEELIARLSEPLPRNSLDRPAACANCSNYCGESHGRDRLVCAMHPYGVEGETCEDWEGDS